MSTTTRWVIDPAHSTAVQFVSSQVSDAEDGHLHVRGELLAGGDGPKPDGESGRLT